MKMTIMRYIKKIAIKIFKVIYKIMYHMVKVDDHVIIFIAYHGRGYTCNPKYLHQYLASNPKYQDYQFVWALKKPGKTDIPHAKKIRYNGLKYFYYMCKAKYWIVNCKLPKHIQKKPEQVYLQTWHGTPLKRLAHDIIKVPGMTFYRSGMSYKQMTETYDDDVSKYNYMISPNPFSTKAFESSFRIDRERLIETGYPRNDFLTNLTKEQIRELKIKYQLPSDKKILLYAPTWRDNSYSARGYTFELKADFHKWKEILGDEYIVLFKPHYLIINKYQNDPQLEGFLINADADMDINDLYAVSDVMVTDYSSVFFDYANLDRPIYFYMFDLKEYADELRGFYFDIYKTLPGDIEENEDKLLMKIKKGDYDYSRLERFNKEFNGLQDGHCSQRVIDILLGE